MGEILTWMLNGFDSIFNVKANYFSLTGIICVLKGSSLAHLISLCLTKLNYVAYLTVDLILSCHLVCY